MAESIKPEIRTFDDLDSLSKATAEEIIKTAIASVAAKGYFSLVLAGGNTPRALYDLLATDFKDKIPWSLTHIFWGDERYVPKDHPDSNYKMTFETLISKVPISTENIHPIPTEIEDPDKAAILYEQEIREFFQTLNSGKEASFDLILLGIGEDGHTASLFPKDPILKEKEKLVASVVAPAYYPIRQRITITLPLINSAKKVIFLVSGASKRKVVKEILNIQNSKDNIYPAGFVNPKDRLVWFVDVF